ncbi:MAG: Do family serine endopeptidase [Acidobacteria bacterium]|nr:Do family serine endopeptidase [Acidobacteriota bacterium]
MAARKLQFVTLTFALTFVVVTLMVAATGAGSASRPETRIPVAAAPDTGTVTPAQRGGSPEIPQARPDAVVVVPSFADIAEKANPAVVNITATEIVRSGDKKKFEGHAPFEFFFPNPDGRPKGDQDEGDPERQDHGGSGFVISDDGYILTNYHVIEDADRVNIRLLSDNHDYVAKVVGADPDTDLAIVKIDSDHKLPTIPLGDSDRMRVGDWVLAIGNPLAYEHTVTVGVVSAKGRKLYAMNRDTSLDNFIQTDAAINRGNSGGPLLNARGEAIGINAAITVSAQGISFAIPINMAKDIMSQLMSKGKVERGFLGVEIRDIDRDLDAEKREYFRLTGKKGAFVELVRPGLPADRAGLRRGDAITTVDGKPLGSSDDLIRMISAKAPGQKVSLGIVRDGKEQTLNAELMDRSTGAVNARLDSEGSPEAPEAPVKTLDKNLGLVLHEISPEIRREYRMGPEIEGLVIVHVTTTSQAWEKGLREGDVITEVNRKSVTDMDSFRAATKEMKTGSLVNLYVVGQGASRFVTLRVEEE